MNRQEWLSLRRTGIGGSDASIILGMNPWSSKYSLWADKLGLIPDKEETEAMRIGNDLEEYVARRFCDLTGKKVRRSNKTHRHDKHKFMLANVDRVIVGEKAGLECKTTSSMNMKKFKGGEFPANYYCQCVHYMEVLSFERWYLAVLVLGGGFFVYQLTRNKDDNVPDWCENSVYIDDAEIQSLIEAEREFWHLVETETPPEIDGTEATKEALKYAPQPDSQLPPADLHGKEDLVSKLNFWKQQEKEAKAEIQALNNQITFELNGALSGYMSGYEIELKTITRNAYTVQAGSYTRLNIKEV